MAAVTDTGYRRFAMGGGALHEANCLREKKEQVMRVARDHGER
jgi:hypothetical protein